MNSSSATYQRVARPGADELVERHAGLVKRIALHLAARLPDSVELDDLLQAGMLGLLEAARKFEAGHGARFETFAGIRIRGAMLDDLRRGDWAPRSVHRNARRISQAIAEVEAELGRDAQAGEVAAHLGMDVDEYHAMVTDAATCQLFSSEALAEGRNDDGGGWEAPSADPGPAEDVEEGGLRGALADAIGHLPEREQLVLSLYFVEQLNLKEIGAVLGVSESRVSQIRSQATLRLRSRMGDWQ